MEHGDARHWLARATKPGIHQEQKWNSKQWGINFAISGPLPVPPSANTVPLRPGECKLCQDDQPRPEEAGEGVSHDLSQFASPDESELPSVGSVLHASGTCRPCAWFWKPHGCGNGRHCCHCHLCPEGEIKARRKAGVVCLKQKEKGCQEEEDSLTCEEIASKAARAQPAAHWTAVGVDPTSIRISAPALHMPCTPPEPLHASFPDSVLHSEGKCMACTWSCKPLDCKSSPAYAHCHLRPEDAVQAW